MIVDKHPWLHSKNPDHVEEVFDRPAWLLVRQFQPPRWATHDQGQSLVGQVACFAKVRFWVGEECTYYNVPNMFGNNAVRLGQKKWIQWNFIKISEAIFNLANDLHEFLTLNSFKFEDIPSPTSGSSLAVSLLLLVASLKSKWPSRLTPMAFWTWAQKTRATCMKLYKGNVQKIMIQDDQGESEKYKGIDTSVDGVSPN